MKPQPTWSEGMRLSVTLLVPDSFHFYHLVEREVVPNMVFSTTTIPLPNDQVAMSTLRYSIKSFLDTAIIKPTDERLPYWKLKIDKLRGNINRLDEKLTGLITGIIIRTDLYLLSGDNGEVSIEVTCTVGKVTLRLRLETIQLTKGNIKDGRRRDNPGRSCTLS